MKISEASQQTVNNGHTVQVNYEKGSTVNINGWEHIPTDEGVNIVEGMTINAASTYQRANH